ncbi:MAG TPA: hypothetical protein VFX02_07185, partial [Gammaproteobacteria bacterium]|nr:hypothetical protein [Gammaproteobacteria bacterium]
VRSFRSGKVVTPGWIHAAVAAICISGGWLAPAHAGTKNCGTQRTLKAYQCLRNSLLQGAAQPWHDQAIAVWIDDPDIMRKVRAAPVTASDIPDGGMWGRVREYFGWDEVAGSRDNNKYFYFMRYGDFSQVFREVLARDLVQFPELALKNEDRGNYLAWQWGYVAEGAAIAFVRTGDRWYADALLESFDKVLALRDTELGIVDDFHGRKMNAWSSGRFRHYKRVAHATLAGRMVRPITQLLLDLQSDPSLKAAYRDKIERYTGIIKNILLEFESDYKPIPGSDLGYYRIPGTDDLEPMNHVHEVALSFLNVYRITGEEFYLKRAEDIAEVFFESVNTKESGALCWPYQPKWQYKGVAPRHMEPVWKTPVTVYFIDEIAQVSARYKSRNLAGLSLTLKDEILLPGYEVRKWMCSDRGSIRGGDKYASRMAGIAGWMVIQDIEPRVVDWMADFIAARPDMFSKGWFGRTGTYRMYAHLIKPAPAVK